MNILFLTTSLPSLNVSSFYGDLINELKLNGHTILAVAPNINKKTEITKENGVCVLRVCSKQLFGVSNIKKGIAYQLLIINYFLKLRKYFKHEHIDCIISNSLPLEISILIQHLKRKYKAQYYLIHRDFTWQDAVGFGFFKNYSIIKLYYRQLEKKLYSIADHIGCMSDGCIDYIKKNNKYLNPDKLHILYNFSKPIELPLLNKEEIKAKYCINNKFTVVYGGNMSIAQKIENILNLAEACIENKDIVFLLIGQGTYFDKIKAIAQSKNLYNVIFHDLLSKIDFARLLSVCDVGLVCLNEELSTPNIPSKIMSYFNASIPVLASIDYVTDLGTFLDTTKSGLWAYSDDTAKLKSCLLTLYNNKELCIKYGKNGYNFYMKNMLPSNAYSTIVKKINS